MAEVLVRKISEEVVDGRRLGRHVAHDSESKKYPAETATRIVSVSHTAWGLPLNQLSTGKCTAEAFAGAANSAPNYKGTKPPLTDGDTDRIYAKETANEGQPWPQFDPGGTGLWVCKAAKQLGLVKSYRHAFGLDHALKALVLRPVMLGTDWYEGFDNPDPTTGIVLPTGRIRGGHEICAFEIQAEKELVGLWQSWGFWGLMGSGKFCMSFKVLDQMLQNQGDITVPHF